MPDAGRKAPPVACVEDYDDNKDQVKPQSRKYARVDKLSAPKSASKPDERLKKREAAPASDSGYSSIYSGPTQTPNESPGALTVRPSGRGTTNSTQSKMKDNGSTKGTVGKSSRSRSRARGCDDPDCSDPECASQRNKDRRYVLPYHPSRPAAQSFGQYTAPVQPPTLALDSYAQQALATQARRLSASGRARPVSFHGYSSSPGYGVPPPHGPPPSPSAYRNIAPFNALVTQPGLSPNFITPAYGTTPPSAPSVMGSIAPANKDYSARQVSRNYQAFDTKPRPIPIRASSQKPSIRRSSRRASRQHQSESESSEYSGDEYASDSGSLSSCSSQEYRRKKAAARDRKLMPPPPAPPRRPPIQERYTEPLTTHANIARMNRRSREIDVGAARQPEQRQPERIVYRKREIPQPRALHEPEVEDPYSDSYLEIEEREPVRYERPVIPRSRLPRDFDAGYASAGEFRDVDRAGRPGVTYAVDPAFIARARRPVPIPDYAIKESYYSARVPADSAGLAEAYQRQTNGGEPEELTAERIRQEAKSSHRQPAASRVSRKSSVRSTQSKNDGIRIQNGDTVLHVYGQATIAMRGGEDGEPASFVINNSLDPESNQHGSVYSSGSRSIYRRSRDMNPVHEEGGYERAL